MSYYLGTGQGMGQSLILSLPDDDRGGLYRTANNWGYRRRNAQEAFYPDFFATWSKSRRQGGDGAYALQEVGYGPWEGVWGGFTRPNFINGQTLDSVGSPIAATVQGFRTSDDLFVGQIGSDDTGRYSLPTIYLNEAHYLVAYATGAPDTAGTTVNTLIPVTTPG